MIKERFLLIKVMNKLLKILNELLHVKGRRTIYIFILLRNISESLIGRKVIDEVVRCMQYHMTNYL